MTAIDPTFVICDPTSAVREVSATKTRLSIKRPVLQVNQPGKREMETFGGYNLRSLSTGATAYGPESSDDRKHRTRLRGRERQRRRRAQLLVHQRDDERRDNAESRRSARDQQAPAERVARRRENLERMRSARERQEPDERVARRRENAERMRFAWRGSRMPRAWTGLTYVCTRALAPAPFALELPISHCRARLLCGETESLCCRNGRSRSLLPTLPEGWEEMFRTPAFRNHSRKYNNLFGFTAMGVLGNEGFVRQPVPSCVNIHACTYHRLLPAEMWGPVQWYVHDPDQKRVEANALSLDQQLVDAIQRALTNINPYARCLNQLGQEPVGHVSLHVEWEESREIAAIIHHPDSDSTGGPRTVVFLKRSELAPTFINPLHPCTV